MSSILTMAVAVALLAAPTLHADSTLPTCRDGRTDFACGECETNLQTGFNQVLSGIVEGGLTGPRWSEQTSTASPIRVRDGVTIESFLQQVSATLRENNTGAPGKLNYLIMGRSESIQTTRPGFPRVLLKSPDSELWVTFNTDPQSAGYNKVEIQRWDGKAGRFIYQEVDFSPRSRGGRHVDLTGRRCVECHRSPNPRPNWDSYRAWAGVIPPRDDYVETNPPPDGYSGWSDAQRTGISTGAVKPALDGNARAYFNFMDQVVSARTNSRPDRLDILDLPNETRPLPDAPGPPAPLPTQLQTIRDQATRDGYFRIPHSPPTSENRNYSIKTSDLAGASHLAFDQLSGQNMCQVATSLKNHPEFSRFKYALAGLLYCDSNSADAASANEYLPQWVRDSARSHFVSSTSLNLPSGGRVPIGTGEAAVFDAVREHTRQNHAQQDEYKMQRHEDYMSSYLTTVERMGGDEARGEARRVSRDARNGVQGNFSAISDPGGVRGVAESDTTTIAALRYALEPFGVQVGNWSMTLGRNVADTSFAFSDQFLDMLQEQEGMQAIYEEAGRDCNALRRMSLTAMGPDPAAPAPSSEAPRLERSDAFNRYCNVLTGTGASGDAITSLAASVSGATASEVKPVAEFLLDRCVACHSVASGIAQPILPFGTRGARNYAEIRTFLNTTAAGASSPWIDRIAGQLSSGAMPPRGWTALNAGVEATEASQRETARRDALSIYLRGISTSSTGEIP